LDVEDLAKRCRRNSICIVESIKALVDSGEEVSEQLVRFASNLLGQPSKTVKAFLSRYLDVFSRLVLSECSSIGGKKYCIYYWNPRMYASDFPVCLDATGTVLAFGEGSRLPELVAYPASRALDYYEERKEALPDASQNPVAEVSWRVDGYHVTFYYNPDLKRWIPATRTLLHNMKQEKKRVLVGPPDEILNPVAALADKLAEEGGLYEKLRGWEGRTVNFVLELKEPAVVGPNVDVASPEECRLYLLNYRSNDGRLSLVSEAFEELKWEPCVEHERGPIANAEEVRELVKRALTSLTRRSAFLRFERGDPARPLVVEVKSKVYAEAMWVKYASDPKSFIVLVSEGFKDYALSLLVDYKPVKEAAASLARAYERVESAISLAVERVGHEKLLEELSKLQWVEQKTLGLLRGELEKAKRTKNFKRLSRVLAIAALSSTIVESAERLEEVASLLEGLALSEGGASEKAFGNTVQ